MYDVGTYHVPTQWYLPMYQSAARTDRGRQSENDTYVVQIARDHRGVESNHKMYTEQFGSVRLESVKKSRAAFLSALRYITHRM